MRNLVGVLSLFLFLCLLTVTATGSPAVPVPRIKDVDFETWYRLATEADRRSEVNHENPLHTVPKRVVRAGEPYQGHIVLGDDGTEMRIMWAATGSPVRPAVQYGTSSGELKNVVYGTYRTYGPNEMCGATGKMDGYSYTVLLRGLKTDRYYYKFGSFENDEWSKEYSFHTPPAPGSEEAESVKFVAYGDMGYFDSGKRVAERIKDEEVDDDCEFIIHVGDISYADGDDSLWDDFMDQIEPIAARVPYFVNIGNHEVEDGECGTPYNVRFTMPSNGLSNANETRNLWYSFNWGPVHFLQMSTEHDFKIGSPQWNFLAKDLRSVNRSLTPWVIFTGHRMMYSADDGDFGEGMRDELEDLLYENKVDMAWWGHAHQYERTCAVYKKECVKEFDGDEEIKNPGAPVHIVMGMAGKNYQYAKKKTLAEWEDKYEEELGYTTIKADRESLVFKFKREKDGDNVDEFTIFKD